MSGESGGNRRKRVAEGPPFCNASRYTRDLSGLCQIVYCGASLRRKSVNQKAEGENEDREMRRGKRAAHAAQRSFLGDIAAQSHAIQSRKAFANAQSPPVNSSRIGTEQSSGYGIRHNLVSRSYDSSGTLS